MKIPKDSASCEETIRSSRFLTELFPIDSQTAVREKIKAQKQKYPGASHVCHAFICGKNAEIMGMSDDGEPGGTAGRPMLDVIKGSGATNLLVTVTRWFGGTLLGTGGLVHAYSNGAKNVLALAEFEELVEKNAFALKCDYQQYQIVRRVLEDFTLYETAEEFSEEISVRGQIAADDLAALKAKIFDATGGKVDVSV